MNLKANTLALALLLSCGVAIAGESDFAARLLKKFPTTAGAKVKPAFPGFYSVVKGSEVLFINDELSILINGEVVDLSANKSLTGELKQANRPKVDLSLLNPADAIAFGSGTRTLYVFSDPDCPHCRALEVDLKQLRDTRVYVFPFPLTGLHPRAAEVAESIWCAEPASRPAAWQAYLLLGTEPSPRRCDNPLARNLAIGQTMQINGTPALIFADGTLVPGRIPLAAIEAQLQASSGAKVSKK